MIPLKSIVLCLGIIFSLHHVMGDVLTLPAPGNHNLLALDLFYNAVDKKSSENLLFSPLSIESALTLAFAGAEGKTADDIRKALKLEGDKNRITHNFHDFLESVYGNIKAAGPELYISNRLFVSDSYKVLPEFNKIAENELYSHAENINFKEGKVCVNKINKYIQDETHDKIKNLLSEDDINDKTNALLVNGMYFKGQFKYPFNEFDTKPREFYTNAREKNLVDMMHIQGKFNFAYLPEIDATALELPYANSDLSFFIILPNNPENLEKFEAKLKPYEFNYIPSRLEPRNVCAYVPKFRVEYKLDLQQILERIGLSVLFSEKAQFGGIFNSPLRQYLSSIKHKSFFEVDEGAAESAIFPGPSGNCKSGSVLFNADHPFIFAVRSNSAIYFAGHVAKL